MSVSSASRVAHRLLEILQNEWSKKCFSICLTSSCGDLIYKHSDLLKHGVCYHFKVPENLCRVYKQIDSSHAVNDDVTNGHLDGSIGSQDRQSLLPSRPILSTAAILALFDEISTYSMAVHDRGHRPGVSIHLSSEVIRPHSMQSGSNIKIMTRVDKIGRTIGFCSLEVLSADNELLARGKHIKYLPMGAIFDLLAHPFVFPIVLKIYEWFYEPKIKATMHIPPKSFPSLEGTGRVFNILGLSAASDEERRALLGPTEAQHFYVMTVKEITSNMLGRSYC